MKKSAALTLAAVSAAAVAEVSAYAVTDTLLQIALNRKAPLILRSGTGKISRTAKDSSFLAEVARTGSSLRALEHETVHIIGRDRTPLVGHWFPVKNAKRAIVAMHGWRSSWYHDFGMIADFWMRSGCSVLYAEQRGQGRSGGDYMGFGLTERYDCVDWAEWVRARCGKELPVYLSGISMGASAVLMAAGLELPENVHGIMADCGFTSPDAIWAHVVNDNLHLPYRTMRTTVDHICLRRIHMRSDEYSTLQAMESCRVPILLIHGSDDRFVPVDMTYANYKACHAPKDMLIVPGAGHGQSCYTDRNAYENAMQSFWKAHDL